MEQKRFSEEQVIGIRKQNTASVSATQWCCEHGVGKQILMTGKPSLVA